ncbi:sensor histidine kinase [Flindersiella endophytica]
MTSSRPVPWVAPVLYGAVLVAGLYAGLAGLGDTRPALFAGGLAALLGLELIERRRWPAHTPPWPAAGLLALRLALFVLVAWADGSGLSKVLFVLLPFLAYFAFGRVVSIVLGIACVASVASGFQLTVPQWYGQAEPVSDLLMFGIGVVLAIAMASVAAEEQRGRARLQAYASQVAELSATAERNRVARDIHDGLGHHLTAIAVLLEKSATFRTSDPAGSDQALDDARRSARRALEDVRRSVRTMREEPTPFLLAEALDQLVREANPGPPAVTLEFAGDERAHDPATLVALHRAAQEGLTNARRHASATKVTVTVRLEPSYARLVVVDDGHGIAPGRNGFGLLGMRERVQLAGGRVEIDGGPGGGTRLTVSIPGGRRHD